MSVATRTRQRLVQRRYLQRALRLRARRRVARGLDPGVTVVVVSWNSLRFLRVALAAIRTLSPPDTRLLVVDNASRDGTRGYLAQRDDVTMTALPVNVGHETALDLGLLRARTQYVVSLDVDAFPVSRGWLNELLEPLGRGCTVSGAHLRNGFVHPCCLAMRLDRFVDGDHTFLARRAGRRGHADDPSTTWWDTGGAISLRERRRHLIDRTEVRGPGDVGSVFGNVVYHNFYSVRHLREARPDADVLDGAVRRSDALAAWDEAVRRFLVPLGVGDPL